MSETAPSTAESMLARVKQVGRARLRVYIGAAPGVGKTFKMLEDAHELKRKGLMSSSPSSSRTAGPTPWPASATSSSCRSARSSTAASP